MDIFKTPHQKLLEEAGAIPATPGMINTPQQMMMQQSGVMPHYAIGGNVTDMDAPSSLPNASFDARSIPSMSGMPGVGYMHAPQGAMARMQLEKELGDKARVRAGVSGMGMAIPGQPGVKLMPGQMDIGANMPVGPGHLDISANRSINPIPGRGHMQGVNARYSIPFAQGGSVEDMLAELIHQGHTPEHFSSGGQSLLPEESPYFKNFINKASTHNFDQMFDQANPEPTFQAQPVTPTSWTRDQFAKVIGDKPADRLFGTGSEGQKIEYMPLQFINPVSQTTDTIGAVPEMAHQLHEGNIGAAGITAGLTALGAAPFVSPIKKIIKKITHK